MERLNELHARIEKLEWGNPPADALIEVPVGWMFPHLREPTEA